MDIKVDFSANTEGIFDLVAIEKHLRIACEDVLSEPNTVFIDARENSAKELKVDDDYTILYESNINSTEDVSSGYTDLTDTIDNNPYNIEYLEGTR
jgi:hypothetical protein